METRSRKEKPPNPLKLHEKEEQDRLYDWIVHNKYKPEELPNIYEIVFKYDLVHILDHLVLPHPRCWDCMRLVCKANASKCLKRIIEQRSKAYDYYFTLRFFALPYCSKISILNYLWTNMRKLGRCLVQKRLGDLFAYNQTQKVIVWAIEHEFKCGNISAFIHTKLERQFLIKITNSVNWDDVTQKLSWNCSRQLRHAKKLTLIDKKLHAQTVFSISDPKSKEGYSFLFMQLYYDLQYKRVLKNVIGISEIESIVKNYLYPLDKSDFRRYGDSFGKPLTKFKFL